MLNELSRNDNNFSFYFQDCHGSLTDNPAPIQDDTQNYLIDSGYQNATHTQVRKERIFVIGFIDPKLFFFIRYNFAEY